MHIYDFSSGIKEFVVDTDNVKLCWPSPCLVGILNIFSSFEMLVQNLNLFGLSRFKVSELGGYYILPSFCDEKLL